MLSENFAFAPYVFIISGYFYTNFVCLISSNVITKFMLKQQLQLLKQVPDDQQYIDLRVSVLGSFDVGKSTLLGVLTQGELDNGRGRARLNMFRHLHEIQSGISAGLLF